MVCCRLSVHAFDATLDAPAGSSAAGGGPDHRREPQSIYAIGSDSIDADASAESRRQIRLSRY